MTSHQRRTWMSVVIAVFAVGLAGCKEEESGTRNIVDIVSLNANQPLLSDVYNFGDNLSDPIDDSVPVDIAEVTFQSRIHDDNLDTIGPGRPFGSVRFTRYKVEYVSDDPAGLDLDGDGAVDLQNFEAPMVAVVPTGGTAQGYVLVVSGGNKVLPPLSCLGPVSDPDCATGNYNPPCGRCLEVSEVEYAVNAQITFYGTEETSGDEVTLQRGVTIRVGNFSDAQ